MVLTTLALGGCGGSAVGSADEAEEVVRETIRKERLCADVGGVNGDVVCKPRGSGWECSFGVSEDAFTGTMYVPPDGHAEYASIC